MTECWRAIPGSPGYFVSDHGRVRGVSGKVLAPRRHTNGYQRVSVAVTANVYRDRYVHELVLLAFVGPRPAGHDTDHIDGNRANNQLPNLRWLLTAANLARRSLTKGADHHSAVLDEAKVRAIRLGFSFGIGNTELGRLFGVARRTVADIRNGKTWSHVQ